MPAMRPTSSSLRIRQRLFAATATLALLAATTVLGLGPAGAQTLDFRSQVRPTQPKAAPVTDPQMLVQSTEIQYDYTNERVVAVGNVQIYYKGSTIEADRVVYDQKTKHLQAEGNVRLTEPDGKITYGSLIDLTDDYRDGFIDSLRIETPDQTRFAAARGQRTGGNYTVFESGVYTACEPCKDNPQKPPLWQVKAARIIHDQNEKMVYFEDAKIEFFGVPLAYMPYFSAPDPTVKRKSGFLMPLATTSTIYGYGLETPYYFALAPNYDLTLSPRVMTRQGLLMQGEWRHRLEDGYYSIKGAGIFQADKDYFVSNGVPTSGFRDFRGSIETTGRFNLSPRWTWGFDGILITDPTFFDNYKIKSLQSRTGNEFFSNLTEGVSQIFLTGRGDRSYFDIRAMHFYGFSESDVQKTLPVVHPVMDYTSVLNQQVLGGEVSYRANLTSLSREQAEYNAISQAAFNTGLCSTTADTAKTAKDCLLRGIPGTYSRLSAEVDWRTRYVDSFGQVFVPFASLRADAAQLHVNSSDPSVANFIQTGDSSEIRVMPTIGLEYRLPLISVQSWGTQTIEPIAQIIARPNESNIGKLPNEDAQSLVFDDSNLFRVDKFSGWDRVEGGGRANYGIQYTAQVNGAGAVNMLIGQSYHLFGTNSFAVGDTSNTGLDSGLDKRASDYVARFAYTPNRIFSLISRYRFDESDLTLQRLEVEGRMSFDRWNVSMMYGNYAAQPELGFLERREGVLGSGSVKLDANWIANGAIRYDIENSKISQTRVGLGYMDDCFLIGLNYITDYTYSGNVSSNHTVMLQIGLRTIGSTSSSSTTASSIGTTQ
ncbi:LPS-assembly protein LptD [Rhodoplanes roseus]|uniref:LPS-assembly protein LptD n=1 Tax=Rhodoplanes roseus TaxID=29409 RepID=A0A327KWK2_9BRAD|nr:LPS-assembly protein LptD [Rhodoplanes roseus]RAI41602.1 organic solvent tolerance protein [Rhodoplanes roseus]